MQSLKIPETFKYYLWFFIFSLISVFFVEVCYFLFNVNSAVSWMVHNPYLLIISILIVMTFMVLLFALTRHLALAIFIPTLAFICYGVGLYFKLVYRKVPALPYELSMILDLKEMLAFLNMQQRIGVYSLTVIFIVILYLIFKHVKRKELSNQFRITHIVISLYIIVMIINYNTVNPALFVVFNVLFTLYILYDIYKWKDKIIYKVMSCILVFAFILPSYNANPVKTMVSYKAMYPEGDFAFKNFRLDGVVPAFLSYANLDYIDEPNNYSEEAIADIVARYKDIERTQNTNRTDLNNLKPNIVYIMSESLSDPRNVEGISINENPLKNLDELSKEYFSGTTVAQGFGGGTNMSEFEALTGVSSIFLNNAMFFNNIAKRKEFPSIVSLLENEGYQSAAVHFNSPMFYNRSVGYENLGVDYFYNDEELELQYFDNNQSYSNDESSFNEILKLLNEYNKPTFIHNVTIQNHGPYPFQISNNQYKVEGLFDEEKTIEAETYLKEIEHSDQEFKKFLEQLETFDEPTIIVFWGDHLPYFYDDSDFGSQQLDKYRTPFLVYSNFGDNNEGDMGELSMNYITTSVFNAFNFKQSAYFYLLNDLESVSGVLQGNFLKEDRGNLYVNYKEGKEVDEEVRQIFKDYEMILYDLFEGENYAVEMNFFNIE